MKVAVCDDEKAFRDRIIGYLEPYKEKYPEITVVEYGCGEDLVKACDEGQKIDVLFLDILLKDIDGVETAKKIRKKDKTVIIIFITGHISYVAETFRLGAFQYLLKPVTKEDFIKDFDRAMESYRINHYKHIFKRKDDFLIIEINEILFIEVNNRHLAVNTVNDRYECLGTITEEENKLAPYHFIRCHNSYLINMKYIKLIGSESIVLANGTELPLSKQLKSCLKSAFNSYILECAV